MKDAKRLSKLLWDAREICDMYASLVASFSVNVDNYITRTRDGIDAYRAEQGWSPNGFGNEVETDEQECARLSETVAQAIERLDEVAYYQIGVEKMLTLLPTGPYTAQVPPHWQEEADDRARPFRAFLRAALSEPYKAEGNHD